jgi:hypothetical protein
VEEWAIIEWILLGVIFAGISVIIATLSPTISSLLISLVGGEQGVYNFLVKLPIIPDKVDGQYVWPGTSKLFDPWQAGFIGPAAIEVFLIIRNISLMFFAFVLIVSAICYVTESFRVMREGTALSILTGSIFALIFIFLALPIYNTVAALFNELTDPKRNLILSDGMIGSIVKNSIFSGSPNIGEALTQAYTSAFFLIMTTVAMVLAAVLGIMRLFMLGALIAMFPLWIILRAIPVTRRVGESMIEQIVGLTLASLVSAIILRFGYEAVAMGCFMGLTATVASIATLITAAMMPTVLAPRLGGLMTAAALTASQAVSTATQVTMGTALGGLTGALTPALGAAGTALRGAGAGGLRGAAAALSAAGYTPSGVLKSMASGFLAGAGRGLVEGFTHKPLSAAGVSIPSPTAISRSIASGARVGLEAAQSQIIKGAGSSLGALLDAQVAKPVPGESGDAGLEWYESVKNKPAEIGRFFSQAYPEGIRRALFGTLEAQAALGAAIKPQLDQLASTKPFLLDRLRVNVARISGLSDQEKLEIFSDALKNRAAYGAEAEKLMNISFGKEALARFDSYMGFYRDVFMKGLPQDVTQTAGTMIYALTLDGIDVAGLDPSKYFTKEDRELGRMYYDGLFMNPDGTWKRDEEIGRWLKDSLKMPSIGEEHVKDLGHSFKQMAAQMMREEPALFKNLYEKIERGAKFGEWPNIKMTKANYEDLAMKVEVVANRRMLAHIGEDAWRGFWENIVPGGLGSGGATISGAAIQPTKTVPAAPELAAQPAEAPKQLTQPASAVSGAPPPSQGEPLRGSIRQDSQQPAEGGGQLEGAQPKAQPASNWGSKKNRYYLHDPEDLAELERTFRKEE